MKKNILSAQQLETLKQEFDRYDISGDGCLNFEDVLELMRMDDPNVTEDEVQDRINEVDYDGNGKIEFEEFVLIQSKRVMESLEQKIRKMFKAFDEDGNNSLSVMELQKGIAEFGDEFTIEELE